MMKDACVMESLASQWCCFQAESSGSWSFPSTQDHHLQEEVKLIRVDHKIGIIDTLDLDQSNVQRLQSMWWSFGRGTVWPGLKIENLRKPHLLQIFV